MPSVIRRNAAILPTGECRAWHRYRAITDANSLMLGAMRTGRRGDRLPMLPDDYDAIIEPGVGAVRTHDLVIRTQAHPPDRRTSQRDRPELVYFGAASRSGRPSRHSGLGATRQRRGQRERRVEAGDRAAGTPGQCGGQLRLLVRPGVGSVARPKSAPSWRPR